MQKQEKIEELKQKVEVVALMAVKSIGNLTEYMETPLDKGEDKGILFDGETITVQIADNSPKSIAEAREHKLPIVDYSACERELKELSIIPQDEKLFAINTVYDAFLLKNSSFLNNSTSNSRGVTTELVDSKGNKVDSSQCTSFTIKLPINNNLINVTNQEGILTDLAADIFNSSDPIFNDKCRPFPSTNGIDLTLESRRNKFDMSSLCSEGTEYKGVDEHQYAICEAKTLPKEAVSKFEKSVFTALANDNIKLFKCWETAFINGLSNYAVWCLAGTSLLGSSLVLGHILIFDVAANIQPIYLNDCVTINPSSTGKGNPKNSIDPQANIELKIDKHLIKNIEIIPGNKNNEISEDYNIKSSKIDLFNKGNNLNASYQNVNYDSYSLNSENMIKAKYLFEDIKTIKIEKNTNSIKNVGDADNYKKRNNTLNASSIIVSDNDISRNIASNNNQINDGNFVNNLFGENRNIIREDQIHNQNEIQEHNYDNISNNQENDLNNPNNNNNIQANNDYNTNREDIANFFHDDVLPHEPKTHADLANLPQILALKYDNRNFIEFFWDQFKEKQEILNLILIKSIKEPFFLRLIRLLFGISLDFAFNTYFFNDTDVDKQAEIKEKEGANAIGFGYVLANELMEMIFALMISMVVVILTNLIIRIPADAEENLNTALQSEDKQIQEEGM